MAAMELIFANLAFFAAFEEYRLFKNSYPDMVRPGFIKCSKCGVNMMSLCVDTSDAVKINELFTQLKEEDKNMSIAFVCP